MTVDARNVALGVAIVVGLGVGGLTGFAHTDRASIVDTANGTGTAAESGADWTLVVASEEETLLTVSVEPGDSVALEYTHSVEKTPVRDVYEIREDGLVLTRTEFQSYGAGLPATADVRLENGTFVHEPPATDPGPRSVAPGEVAGHELVVGDDRFDLVALADAPTVVLTVETRRR